MNLKPALNPEHPSAAYQCGRLMAILADIQRAALGDVGANVIQRYYASASTTPALVFGRIIRTAQFHLNKVGGSKPGLDVVLNRQLAEIMDRLKDGMPATLSLEQQSLFALGFYQQIAARPRGKREGGEQENGSTDQIENCTEISQ